MIMSYLIALYFIAMMTALDGYSYCDDYLVYSSDEDVKTEIHIQIYLIFR